ncbi:MAG: signal peptide peptidase SppA [Lentisphaeria bacterium]
MDYTQTGNQDEKLNQPNPQTTTDTGRPQQPPVPPPTPQKRKRGGCLIALLIGLGLAGCGLAVLFVTGIIFSGFSALGTTSQSQRVKEIVVQPRPGTNAKIAIIDVKGVIRSAAGYRGADPAILRKQFQKAIKDPNVKAVVLDLNTPGGEVTASDEIYRGVKQIRKAGKPVIGCMRSVCASGGYYVASACDYLVANRVTLTGSIGVVFPHFTYRELLDKIGIQQSSYTSGKMKDMFSGGVTRSETEQQLIDTYMQKLVKQTFERFLQVVAEGRSEYDSMAELKKATFSDGRVILGETALNYGLVDQLGYLEHAVEKARKMGNASNAKAVRYQESFSLTEMFLAKTTQQSIKIEGLPKVMPTLNPHNLYYLMPTLTE